MSSRTQHTTPARTPLSRRDGFLLALPGPNADAVQLTLASVALLQVPRRTVCGGRCSSENGVARPPSAFVARNGSPQQKKSSCRPVALASPTGTLRRGVFIERRLSRISLLSLGHSLRCLSRARRHSPFCFAARPAGFGFQKIFSAISAKNAEGKDFPNLPKKHVFGLGSGAHSRRFAQECPEGTSGKYEQEKRQWHSTKTKSS